MGRDPFLPLGWSSTIKECNGDENCNEVYRSVVSCLGLEGLEQLRTRKLDLSLVQKCGPVLQSIIDSRRDMSDLAMDFVITMNYIDNVLAEPMDIYTATMRIIGAMKAFLGYAEKARESGNQKVEEFVLDVLVTAIYGIMSNYLAERKGDILIRMKMAKLASALATLASPSSTQSSESEDSSSDWW